MSDKQTATIEQVIRDMGAAFARHDVEGLLALFAEDATLESYLVARVFQRKDGVCHGRAEIRSRGGRHPHLRQPSPRRVRRLDPA